MEELEKAAREEEERRLLHWGNVGEKRVDFANRRQSSLESGRRTLQEGGRLGDFDGGSALEMERGIFCGVIEEGGLDWS